MKCLIAGVFIFSLTICKAQTEHNFTMGPSNTTCDSLKTEGVSDIIGLVKNSKFRLAEELKVSRYKTPQHVWFYSCDGKTGFLIAKEKEDHEVIFVDVSKEDWTSLFNSKDPVTTYWEIKRKYGKG